MGGNMPKMPSIGGFTGGGFIDQQYNPDSTIRIAFDFGDLGIRPIVVDGRALATVLKVSVPNYGNLHKLKYLLLEELVKQYPNPAERIAMLSLLGNCG